MEVFCGGRQQAPCGCEGRVLLTLHPWWLRCLPWVLPSGARSSFSSPLRRGGERVPQCRTATAAAGAWLLTAPSSSVQTGILVFLETASSGVLKTERKACSPSGLASGHRTQNSRARPRLEFVGRQLTMSGSGQQSRSCQACDPRACTVIRCA